MPTYDPGIDDTDVDIDVDANVEDVKKALDAEVLCEATYCFPRRLRSDGDGEGDCCGCCGEDRLGRNTDCDMT